MKQRVCLLLAGSLALLTYLSAVPNAFTNWDDRALALAEPSARTLSMSSVSRILREPIGRTYLPLRKLSYLADYALWGQAAWGYHLTNVLLHGANSALVLVVASRLCGSLRMGLLVACLFAVHPVQTESVAWVAGRRDVLSALFYLAGVAWYLRAMVGRERALAAVGLLLLACLSKGTSVVFPAMALVLEWFWPGRTPGREPRRWVRQAGVWAVAVAMIVVHVSVGRAKGVIQPAHGGSAAANAVTMSKAFGCYVAAMAWPLHLSARHAFPPTTALAWLAAPAAFALLTVLSLVRRRWRLAGICLAWFAVGLAPVSGILFPLSHPYAERYLYVPGLGLLILAARVLPRRAAAGVLWVCVAWSALTVQRTFDWHTSQTMWRSAVRVEPRSYAASQGLLFTHMEDERFPQAAAVARLMRATDADPFITRLLLAQTLFRAGRHVEARGHAVEAIALRPDDARGYVVAGDVERSLGESASARKFYERAIALDPDCGEAHFGLGVLHEHGNRGLALKHYKAAARLQPNHAEVHYNLGNVLWALEYNAHAEREYQAAIRINPHHARALCNLGTLYMRTDAAKAEQALQKAAEVDPGLVQAHLNLAILEESTGRRQAAIQRLERVLQERPRLAAARRELQRMKAGKPPR